VVTESNIAQSQELILDVKDLSIAVATPLGPKTVVDKVSFELLAGETLCLAGESGSGKSMIALSLMGLLPNSARVISGQALLSGENLLQKSERELRYIRGADIAMIFQEPMTSLNPVMSVGAQLDESIMMHTTLTGAEVRAKSLQMLESVRMSEPKRRLQQYPHELSGGMRQRVMIAMALSCNPKLLIADEPTTALDVTIQAQILTLMDELKKEIGTAIILITHDMGVVAEVADRVIVMNSGKIVEQNSVIDVFQRPQHSYTQELLAAVPKLGSMRDKPAPNSELLSTDTDGSNTIVEVKNLNVGFNITGGILQRPVKRVHAVENVSFKIARGETLALVGESGCGKSTIGKALLNLNDWHGEIEINHRPIQGLSPAQMFVVRRDIQMIFQDPYASLDSRMTVGELVGEPLVIHRLAKGQELRDRVENLFLRVGLDADHLDRYPHEFSGGQRQRICIARALSLSPKIIVADESVSALDVSVQAQVLELMQDLQSELGLSYLFISHDMAVVEQISHRVAIMHLGQIVEIGCRADIFQNPQHAYTRKLMEAVPIADPLVNRKLSADLKGEIPSPVRDLDFVPQLHRYRDNGNGHFVAVDS